MKRKRKNTKTSQQYPPDPAQQTAAFRDLLSPGEYELLLSEIDSSLPPAIRVNPLKTDPSFPGLLRAKYGWQLEPVPFCPTGYRILNTPASEISAALEHHLGMYYIQEVASMLPVELFSTFSENEVMLDMAASPGGKTTHLISRGDDRGLVLANDSSQGRIRALRSVLQNWGAVNYGVTRFPAERFGEWFPHTFDKILLDAPCSMQGLRTADSHPSRPVSAKESLQLSRRQQTMLSSAIHALRVGGEVVYSTCTLLPEEDEMVVDAMLREFGKSIEIVNTSSALPSPAPGLSEFREKVLSKDLVNSIRLWPHRYRTAGFFACHLRKVDSTDVSTSEPPSRSLESVNFQVFTHNEESDFCSVFAELYGFDHVSLLQSQRAALVRHFEQVFIFPLLLLERFASLPLQAAGMLLGEDTPDGFLPSQAWVNRFGALCKHGTIQLDKDQSAEWIMGNNLVYTAPGQMPQQKYLVILNHEGYALGRAALSNGNLKNLLRRQLS